MSQEDRIQHEISKLRLYVGRTIERFDIKLSSSGDETLVIWFTDGASVEIDAACNAVDGGWFQVLP
jgi:hypothetical protein